MEWHVDKISVFILHEKMRNGLTLKNYLQQINKYWRLHCSQRVSPDWPTCLMSFSHSNRIQQMCDQHSEAPAYFHMGIGRFDCMNNGFYC